MSWGAVAGAVIGGVAAHQSSKKAADATKRAAGTSADAQMEALEYMREREAIPQEIREKTLLGLQDFYQVPDQPASQEELITQARQSPLYGAIMGTQEAGEEAILRNASATGGLRSGRSNARLSDYGMQLENQALLQSFQQAQQRDDYERNLNLQGLSGLAQLPSNANAIAQQMGNIGQTQAMGIQGAAQARQQGMQNILGNTLGFANLGLQAYGMRQNQNDGTGAGADGGSGFWFSDVRLKDGIEFVGERGGFNFYRWTWNEEAKALGLEGEAEGVLAHEVAETHPEAIGLHDDYITVSYDALGITEH